ncbi:TetR family transcriptional regulator [Mycobacterium paraense]|uniref:TetR family transcriptional regulator n=1 Tax=Mycobacterium paraense TaxID=767916 RepID=A0ABX3VQX7_9MYCO|nr:TetR/AcrR family transcriptional regulator [Mycobacterium paraense]ORW32659.1 TetR family transcriptional regulator [Mycobacterium paraense]ORW37990.1 TetR family transcriptional regulator [Mycobacterium paraense]
MQRSRTRIANQVRLMLDAARRLVREKDDFTTQELVVEAGVALQTFYRYFASKDELLLALIGDAMTEACDRWAEAAADLPDPVQRLRFYLNAPLERFGDGHDAVGMRFIVTTHWHLHRVFPKELAEAEKPYVDLVLAETNAAADRGLIRPRDARWDAWFVVELLRSVYHHYAYAAMADEDLNVIKENLWQFCRAALGVEKGRQ